MSQTVEDQGAAAEDSQRQSVPELFRRDDDFAPEYEPGAVDARKIDGPFGDPVWLVSDWSGGRAVLSDAEHYSRGQVEFAGIEDEDERRRARAGMLLGLDAPDHTRVRRMVTGEFTVKRIKSLQPRIAQIVDDHLDAMERRGSPADLVADFALAVPSLVICELLGVPYEDRQEFQARAARTIDFTLPMEVRRKVAQETRDYMLDLVGRQRRNPGDDLLGRLITKHSSGSGPDDLDDDELAGLGNLLLIAGHETTSNMLALGTLVLLRRPDQLAMIREHPERVDDAVEELLRYLSVVHMALPRVTTSEVMIGSVTIPKGELVVVSLPASNRDPDLLGDPGLDVSREPVNHVAFGHGIHHCLGAPLARAEMQIAFPALFRRFPTLRLAIEPAGVDFRTKTFIYGLHSLPVAWDPITTGKA